MTDGAPWSLSGEELALVRYVRPAEVARHLMLPERSGDGPLTRLRAVYAALAAKEVGYAEAAAGAEDGMQVIRPTEQVLWAPGHGTCLDLAVVLAGACLVAELHPVVVILDPPGGRGFGHALVLVRLDRDRRPRTDGLSDLDVWRQPPATLFDEVQPSLDGPPGDVVAVDPIGLAVSLGTSPVAGLHADLADAVANGARYLTGGTWRLGVDVGSAWRDTHKPLAVLPALKLKHLREWWSKHTLTQRRWIQITSSILAIALVVWLTPGQTVTRGTFVSPTNGQEVRGKLLQVEGTVEDLSSSSYLLCILKDELSDYYPHEAQVADGGWTADVGIGPADIDRRFMFTLILATATQSAFDDLRRLREANPDDYYTNGIPNLPADIKPLKVIVFIRTS